MQTSPSRMKDFFRNSAGATLVEYGIALLVVIIVGAAAFTNLGGQTSDNFNTAKDQF